MSCLSARCGEPTEYPDKQLHKRYLNKLMFNHGEQVRYTCLPGYTPSEGSLTSRCQEGHWTALDLKCQSKMHLFICVPTIYFLFIHCTPRFHIFSFILTEKKCNALGDIENGQYIQQGRLFGDKAIAMCNKGYLNLIFIFFFHVCSP